MYKILVREPEGKRPLGRPRRRWNEIRMDPRGIGSGGVDLVGSEQGQVVGCCEYGDEPSSCCATELVTETVHL
jgi:hypothetical protein